MRRLPAGPELRSGKPLLRAPSKLDRITSCTTLEGGGSWLFGAICPTAGRGRGLDRPPPNSPALGAPFGLDGLMSSAAPPMAHCRARGPVSCYGREAYAALAGASALGRSVSWLPVPGSVKTWPGLRPRWPWASSPSSHVLGWRCIGHETTLLP